MGRVRRRNCSLSGTERVTSGSSDVFAIWRPRKTVGGYVEYRWIVDTVKIHSIKIA